jgi:hypothetical protein
MMLRNVIREIIHEAAAPEGTGVIPAGGETTAAVPELQARSRAVVAQMDTPWEQYNKQVERVAQKVAKALGMMEVRYLAKSNRNYGAIAYKAISPNYTNVVIKIAPEHELQGYYMTEAIKQQLPEKIAKHLPRIYKLTNMKKLGIEWPKSLQHEVDRNLGIIVMEELEELPGAIFDLIKAPPQADDFVLEVFLNDHTLLNDFIESVLVSSSVTSEIEKFLNHAKPQFDISDVDEVKSEIKRMLMLLSNFKYPRFEPSMFHRADLKKPSRRVSELTPKIEELIFKALKKFDPNIEKVSDTIKELGSEVANALMLQRRAIPTEPSMGQKYGIMSGLKMISDLRDAVKYMTDHGIFVSDLHANNLMLRPETMEIVISDLGHFEQESNLQNVSSSI